MISDAARARILALERDRRSLLRLVASGEWFVASGDGDEPLLTTNHQPLTTSAATRLTALDAEQTALLDALQEADPRWRDRDEAAYWWHFFNGTLDAEEVTEEIPPPRVCVFCGRIYAFEPGADSPVHWEKRQYCSKLCLRRAWNERRQKWLVASG